MPANTTCFVISPIGDPDSPTRKRSDQVLKHIIGPAAQECGFTALRSDHISETGIITSQVIQHIIEDPMVIADLTGSNANVFYELAIRHAIRRPYVQIMDENEPLPFDVAGIRTIQFTHRDLDSADIARKEIVKHIHSMTAPDAHFESPITAAVDLSDLKNSRNPEDRRLGEVLTALAELKQQVSSLQHRVTIPLSQAASSPYIIRAPDVSIPLSDVGRTAVRIPGVVVSPDGSLTISASPLFTEKGSVTISGGVDRSITGDSIPKEP